MKRRDLLAAAGSLGALGAAGCLSRGGAGPASPDTETETPTETADPTPTEPVATETVGAVSGVLLPGENRPHGLRVRNAADGTRDIGVRIASGDATRFDREWTLAGHEFVSLTLVEPAAYTVHVSVDGESVGEVSLDPGFFDCNDSQTTVDVLPDESLDERSVSTLVECRSPIVRDHDFEVTRSGCGGTDHGATVSFESDAVAVAGVISAPDPCHGAELAGAAWDGEDERLTLTVATTEGDEQACVDCVGEIEYETRVSFAGGPPAAVAVEHRHWDRTETVATARR